MGFGRKPAKAKVRSLQEERMAREMRQHVNDALMVLVRREGRLWIPLAELRQLRSEAGISIEASPEGLRLTYVEPGGSRA
jgi:hypothetical protein